MRPKYIYKEYTDLEVYLEAGKMTDPLKGGDILNTEAFGLLICRFRDSSNSSFSTFTSAFMLNNTVAGCPMALISKAATILIDLSVDGGIKYSNNFQTIFVIEPPIVVGLNNTNYYYTLNESVFIAVTGYYFNASGNIYAQVNN